jgi:hypothetical protein
MADEAFALSPISARATLPSEEDYAAISEAFMETSRGRWFLTEYAKRNRNADTRMVLDAVARIEQSLATQREENLHREESLRKEESLAAQQAAADAAVAAAKDSLSEALAAIGDAVDAAQESAIEALDSLALEQRLAPVRKGARVLREIAWRLREIGNDGRICDLIDSQVAVIETGAEQISAEEARTALRAAFVALEAQLAEFGDDRETVSSIETEAGATPTPAPPETPSAAIAELVETVDMAQQARGTPPAPPGVAATIALAEAEAVLTETAEAPAIADTIAAVADPASEPVQAASEVAELTGEVTVDADAVDEALLDAIAMEMGAPDPISEDEIAAAVAEQSHADEPAPVEPEVVPAAPLPQPIVPPPAPATIQTPAPVVTEAVPAPAVEMSLGSSILASGMLRKPVVAANDPLAPIRRMSQAEKIAFFS